MPDDAPRVLSLLSHELRGPLGVVRGYLRLLDQSAPELSEPSRQAVAGALRASDRLSDVLDEASYFAHLRVGDVPLELKPASLAAIVRAAIDGTKLPDHARVDVNPEAHPDVTIHADQGRLRLALATLITAVVRPHSSDVVVEISWARTRWAEHEAVDLRIAARTAQTGPGGEVTEGELNRARGGFGLAIPIADAIVEAHGGRVRELQVGDRSDGIVVSLPTT